LYDAILLYSDHQHVSAPHVSIFRVVSAIIQTCIYIYSVSGALRRYNRMILTVGHCYIIKPKCVCWFSI